MSVHRKDQGWVTRWREGGRQRSRAFDRKRDAVAWDAEVRRRRRLGELDLLEAGRETLDEFASEWWRLYAEPNLAAATRTRYAEVWDKHVLRRIGSMELRTVTPEVLERFTADLRQAGVGEPTITKALTLLSSVLGRAVTWGRISRNPVAAVHKPRQPRPKRARAISPSTVEGIRAALIAQSRHGDAVLVSVLAYAGLRPGEALALRWHHVGDKTLYVEQAVSDGAIGPAKTGQRRSVRLLPPVAQDLREWRLASGRPHGSALVFPRRDGEPWRSTDYRNWRRRVFGPAAEVAGQPKLRPYDLRHSFVSLLIAEGDSIVEIACQAGHSPMMSLNVYGHALEEFSGKRVDAGEAIKRARMFPLSSPTASEAGDS